MPEYRDADKDDKLGMRSKLTAFYWDIFQKKETDIDTLLPLWLEPLTKKNRFIGSGWHTLQSSEELCETNLRCMFFSAFVRSTPEMHYFLVLTIYFLCL